MAPQKDLCTQNITKGKDDALSRKYNLERELVRTCLYRQSGCSVECFEPLDPVFIYLEI